MILEKALYFPLLREQTGNFYPTISLVLRDGENLFVVPR